MDEYTGFWCDSYSDKFRFGDGENGNGAGGDKGTALWRKLWHFFQFNREEFLAHYHRRSNVETVFSMIKAKFGSAIRSKSETAQTNEVLCKVLCHNLCVLTQAIFEFGIEPKFWADTESVGKTA